MHSFAQLTLFAAGLTAAASEALAQAASAGEPEAGPDASIIAAAWLHLDF